MSVFVDYEVPAWLLISLSFCLFIAIFLLEHYRKIALKNESAANLFQAQVDGNNAECTSPGCIRCNKTKTILERARHRLSSHSIKDLQLANNEIGPLLKDIQQSLSRASKSKNEETNGICTDVGIKTSSPNVLFIRGLRERNVVSQTEFSGLNLLTDNYGQINLEFMHLYQSPLPETKAMWKTNTTDKGKWEIAQLIDQGSHTRASKLCPLTMNFLGQISSVMNNNVFGNAAFSVVHPKTSIERHCGSTNCRVRCHLGLQIPQNCCSLEVDGTHLNWEEGDVLCFNDAFPHSVSHAGNKASGFRVVLMVDLWHPDVTESQRKLIDFAFCGERDM